MQNVERITNSREHSNGEWCALHTRHQHEKSVAALLVRQGFQIFLPTYDSVRRWSDRKKHITLPLFPGYVFLIDESRRRLQVLSTPGVHAILTTGKVPAVIPSEEIGAIRRAVESALRVEPHHFSKSGEAVRIKSGPLAGLEGIVSREKDRFRVVLSVELLGRSAAVEIDASATERLSPPAEVTFQPMGHTLRHAAI
ncbi:MAG: UpxY family transcription antiterminator [Candidatus Acidiferrales bacterium]